MLTVFAHLSGDHWSSYVLYLGPAVIVLVTVLISSVHDRRHAKAAPGEPSTRLRVSGDPANLRDSHNR